MYALLTRLSAYKKMIVSCIDAADNYDDILVCKDFITLFGDRFKPLMNYEDFVIAFVELNEMCEEKLTEIKTP